MRHGRSSVTDRPGLDGKGFGQWVADYDAAGIDPAFPPPPSAISAVQRCDWVVCSDLSRSVESARALGVARIHRVSRQCREFDMPYPQGTRIRMNARNWSLVCRLAWLIGYSANSESVSQARSRSRTCADRLESDVERQGRVLFVGHGMLLAHLGKTLRTRGWRAEGAAPRRHWEHVIYRRG